MSRTWCSTCNGAGVVEPADRCPTCHGTGGAAAPPGAWLNPDCAGGKHPACAGDAWNENADTITSCECPCHQWISWKETDR